MTTTAKHIVSGLDHPTLVLNKGWRPIDAITAREALSDAVAEKARIICTDSCTRYDIDGWMALPVPADKPSILTTRSRIRVPEVICSRYDRIPKRTVVFSRRNLWRRDGWRCQYCGQKPALDEITVDHVVPRSHGGLTTFENTVLACVKCNKNKDDRTPEQAGMKLRKLTRIKDGSVQLVYYDRPKTPRWSPIFAVRRQAIPTSWKMFLQEFIDEMFLQDMIDEMYWNAELEP